jgi:hypothetical protein
LGKEDKHQFTVLGSATTDGVLLPLQVVFQGKTGQVLPKNAATVIAASEGWHLTHSANHWSTQETMRNFVQKVLHPYFEGKCFDLGLNLLTQRMIWLIDYWLVHISAEFRGFMKENFPHILLLFVPANCTFKLQVMDVVFQRPFKHAIHQLYNQFQAVEIAKQIKAGVNPSKVKLQTTPASSGVRSCASLGAPGCKCGRKML